MHGLVTSTSRLTLTSNLTSSLLRSGRSLRALSKVLTGNYSRAISTSTALRKGQWRNDTPEGGLTEILVYTPDSENCPTVWPERSLGVFAPLDPKFDLPGNVGISTGSEVIPEPSDPVEVSHEQVSLATEVIYSTSNRERQSQTLYSAGDYIQHTPGAESDLCSNLLTSFPDLKGMDNLHCEVTEAPSLMRKEVEPLFPGQDLSKGQLSVITLSQRTVNDMSVWSNEMEEEREALTEQFFAAAKEIVARLKDEGYWADFIDPSSGTPYFGEHSSTTMFETDEKYRLLGFRIEDLGCCKVISHREFGRNVFVGTIFTNAQGQTGVIQDLFDDLRLALNKTAGTDDLD